MKNVLKIAFVALGFTAAILATTNIAFANKKTGGRCEGDELRVCGTTAGGTTVYGYWTETSNDY